MKYKTAIKQREKEAREYASLIREAFNFSAPVYVSADVEGQPNPDRDHWTVRAQVRPGVFVVFQQGPHRPEGQATLALLAIERKGQDLKYKSEMREVVCDRTEAVIWISRAWMHLNPEDPAVMALKAKERLDQTHGNPLV